MNNEELRIYNLLRSKKVEGYLYLAPDNKTVYALGQQGQTSGLYAFTRIEPFDPESETLEEELTLFVEGFFK